MSVARLHHRKDVTPRPVSDLPTTTVGLSWPVDRDDDRVQAFIGIVRGRTASSSRLTGRTASRGRCDVIRRFSPGSTALVAAALMRDHTGATPQRRFLDELPPTHRPCHTRRSTYRSTRRPAAGGLDKVVFGVTAAIAVAFLVWGFVSTDSLATVSGDSLTG